MERSGRRRKIVHRKIRHHGPAPDQPKLEAGLGVWKGDAAEFFPAPSVQADCSLAGSVSASKEEDIAKDNRTDAISFFAS